MRVANRTIFSRIKYNLASLSDGLKQANEVVSSGKRVSDLSDDPVGMTQILDIKSSLSDIEQLGRNLNTGKMWLSAGESALTQVQNLISEARALCVQMANPTTSASEREGGALMIQNSLDEILSLANAEVNGLYIFSGSRTTTAPFSLDGAYHGDHQAFSVKIGASANMAVGNDGEAVFATAVTTMSGLRDALQADDVNGIEAAMEFLDADHEHITETISNIGAKALRCDIKEQIYDDLEITHTERLSNIQDADLAEAVVELEAKELAYQAALSSAARVMTLSLVDYLS